MDLKHIHGLLKTVHFWSVGTWWAPNCSEGTETVGLRATTVRRIFASNALFIDFVEFGENAHC